MANHDRMDYRSKQNRNSSGTKSESIEFLFSLAISISEESAFLHFKHPILLRPKIRAAPQIDNE